MRTIQVNYDEVNSKVAQLRGHVTSNIVAPVQSEYRQLLTNLRQTVDGATCASFQETLDANCRKAMAASSVLERLLSFMSNSSRQIQATEAQIARAFGATRRGGN